MTDKVKKELELLEKEYGKDNWLEYSKHEYLSKDFIRQFQDKLDWFSISIYQSLSEPFIREFQDKIYWYNISLYQQLSEDFILEFRDKLDIDELIERKLITQERLELIKRAETKRILNTAPSRFSLMDLD